MLRKIKIRRAAADFEGAKAFALSSADEFFGVSRAAGWLKCRQKG